MLSDFAGLDKVYIACGYTDLRRRIAGLAAMVQQQFNLDSFTNTLFLFCGRLRDRIKTLYLEENGFVVLHKRLKSVFSVATKRKRSKSPDTTAIPLTHGRLRVDHPKAKVHRPINELEMV